MRNQRASKRLAPRGTRFDHAELDEKGRKSSGALSAKRLSALAEWNPIAHTPPGGFDVAVAAGGLFCYRRPPRDPIDVEFSHPNAR